MWTLILTFLNAYRTRPGVGRDVLFPAHTVCVSYPAKEAGGSVILADREARIDAKCQFSAVFIAAGAMSGTPSSR